MISLGNWNRHKFAYPVQSYRFTTYQDARRVRLVDGLIFETNILRVSPVKFKVEGDIAQAKLTIVNEVVRRALLKYFVPLCSCLGLEESGVRYFEEI